MNEAIFFESLKEAARKAGINPVLLLSGVEGLYTFKNVPLNDINYNLLDALILTIFTLRIGDQFHVLAQQRLQSASKNVRRQAQQELTELNEVDILDSGDEFLKSFAQLTLGKSPVYQYHIKALEAAALEIKNTLRHTGASSIGTVVLGICGDKTYGLNLGLVFGN